MPLLSGRASLPSLSEALGWGERRRLRPNALLQVDHHYLLFTHYCSLNNFIDGIYGDVQLSGRRRRGRSPVSGKVNSI